MRKGFTLIELIIVIIIVGVLAAVGMGQYTKAVERSRAAEARLILGTLRTAETADYIEDNAYSDVLGLGVGAPTTCATTHFFSYSCATGTGTCTATRCTTGGKSPQGGSAYTKTLAVDGTWGGTAGY